MKRRGGIPFCFTPLPHTVMDGWLRELSPPEFVVYCCVMRKTWGFNKYEDAIAISQIVEMSGLSRATVKRAQIVLIEKGLLSVRGSCKRPRLYEGLMPRKVKSEWVMGEPTEDSGRIVDEPTDGSRVSHTIEKRKRKLTLLK